MEYQKGDRIYRTLMQTVTADSVSESETQQTENMEEEQKEETWKLPEINFEELKKINEDIIGWIAVENTKISYPLVQGDDNQYYVGTTADLKKNKAGSIFLDFRNNSEFSDKHSVLYGHSLKNGSMFGTLQNFLDSEYVEAHPRFYILTPEKTITYEIYSAYLTTAGSNSYLLDFSKGTSFNQYLSMIQTFSVLDREEDFSDISQIMTLSTCTNGNETERYVVHGSLVSEEIKEKK